MGPPRGNGAGACFLTLLVPDTSESFPEEGARGGGGSGC